MPTPTPVPRRAHPNPLTAYTAELARLRAEPFEQVALSPSPAWVEVLVRPAARTF